MSTNPEISNADIQPNMFQNPVLIFESHMKTFVHCYKKENQQGFVRKEREKVASTNDVNSIHIKI